MHRRHRNPVSFASIKSAVRELTAKSAVKDYAYVTVGFVAGGILPGLLTRALFRAGVLKSPPSQALNVGIGLGSAVIAGVAAGMITKRRDVGVKVAGGAVAGIIGALILREVEKRWPIGSGGDFSPISLTGLGSDAAVRQGIEAEIRRASGMSGGGVGEFLTEERLERELAGGMGAFVTSEIADSASDVSGLSGLGAEVTEDIEDGTDTFDGGGF